MEKRKSLFDIVDNAKRSKIDTVGFIDLMNLTEGKLFLKIYKYMGFKNHANLAQTCKTVYKYYTDKPKLYWMKFIEQQKHANFLFLKRVKPYTTAPLQWYLNKYGWPPCTKCKTKFSYETEKGLPFQPFMKNPLGVYMCGNNCGNTVPRLMCGLTLDDISSRCIATSRQRNDAGEKTHSWQDISFDMPNKADSYCSRCGAISITEESVDEYDKCLYCGVTPMSDCICAECQSCNLIVDECQCIICGQCDYCTGCENCELSNLLCSCEFCKECGCELGDCECDSLEEF